MDTQTVAPTPQQPTKKQPTALYYLFFTEFWERFGFYTVQALLVLYLTRNFSFSDDKAYLLFGAFGALLWGSTVIGGYLADKILGFRRAIYIGGGLLSLGYFTLMLGGVHTTFYIALGLLITGNGFFKSSVSSLLGTFYHKRDLRRDSGFTLFYLGINSGSLCATIFCTFIAYKYGFTYGFALAGIGLIISLIIFTIGLRNAGQHGLPNNPTLWMKKLAPGLSVRTVFTVGIFIAIATFSYLVHFSTAVNWCLIVLGVLILAYIITTSTHLEAKARNRLLVLTLLIIFSIMFWSLYMQIFMSLILFAKRCLDRSVFGFIIPPAMVTSLNPLCLVLLSPLFASLWIRLGKTRYNPSTPGKFAGGIFLMGLGFLVLAFGIHSYAIAGIVPFIWVVICYFLQTSGELFLSPVGLSAVTTLTPPKLVGFMMGVWFVATSAASTIGSKIAQITSVPDTMTNPVDIIHIYQHAFILFGVAAIAIALLLAIITPLLLRLIGSPRPK